jgi:glucosamine--fructose-6-phosphate aminotransferase (isomerizing)
MTNPVSHTFEEIISQPKAWAQALEVTRAQSEEITRFWDENPKMQVVFTGCGSTHYLSLAAAALIQELTGRGARGVPAGELFLYPASFYEVNHSHIMVAVSRSGTTSETLAAVKRFKRAGGGPVLVITNYGDSPLARLGDLTIAIPAGQEVSVAQTRSFASMYVAASAFAAQVAGREDLLDAMERLPAIGSKILETSQPLAKKIGNNLDLDRFYYLGSGPRYGLACETNLKMKEMTLTHSEPFHFMEFRHGPMSMVTGTGMVIGMLSSTQRSHEQVVLDHMKSLGGNVFSLAESDADINFSSGLPEAVCNVLYLPPLQLMSYYRSVAKGLNPDKPTHLSAVVELDLE